MCERLGDAWGEVVWAQCLAWLQVGRRVLVLLVLLQLLLIERIFILFVVSVRVGVVRHVDSQVLEELSAAGCGGATEVWVRSRRRGWQRGVESHGDLYKKGKAHDNDGEHKRLSNLEDGYDHLLKTGRCAQVCRALSAPGVRGTSGSAYESGTLGPWIGIESSYRVALTRAPGPGSYWCVYR